MQVCKELMHEIEDVLQACKMTQIKAAALLSISQTRVHDLLRGRIYNFTLMPLIN